MTTTTTHHKTALKIEISEGGPGMPACVSVYDGKMTFRERSDYWVDLLKTDFGTGLRFRKIWEHDDFADGNYDVLIGEARGNHSCECMGFLRHGHCRHVDAALAIIEAEAIKQARPEQAEERPAKVDGTYCPECRTRSNGLCSCSL